MATYRKVPARIMVVDYVGISAETESSYRRRADQELMKLEEVVLRGNLDQQQAKKTLANNVVVECNVCYNLKKAIVYVGRETNNEVTEKPCYCCSPGLVAGLIIEVKAEEFIDEIPQYKKEIWMNCSSL